MERPLSKPLMKGVVRFLCAVVGINLLYSLIGFYAVPAVLESQVPKQLSPLLHRTVTVGRVDFNPYTLKLRVKDFKIASPESGETLASVDELFADLEGQSLIRQSLILKEAVITSPYLNVVRNEDNTFNFSDLLKNDEKPQEDSSTDSSDKEKKKDDFIFILSNISLKNGRIDLLDKQTFSSHLVTGLNLFVPSVSNYGKHLDQWIEPQVIATLNGGMLYCNAKIKPFIPCLNSVVDTELSQVDLVYYLGYLPPELKLRILSGRVNAGSHLDFARDDEGSETLSASGNLTLENLEAKHVDGSPLLRLKTLDAALDQLDPIHRTVHVSNVTLDAPELSVSRKQGGKISLESIYAREQTLAHRADHAPPTEDQPRANAYSLLVDEVGIREGTVHFSDASIRQPFKTTLKSIGVKVLGLSTQEDANPSFEVAADTEGSEKVKISGNLTLRPLTVTGALETGGIQLTRYAPYYRDQIRFDLKEGTADLKTDYRLVLEGKQPDVQLKQLSLNLHGLRCAREGDPEDFLDVSGFSIRDGSFDLRRKELILKNIESQDGKVFVRREADGVVNLLRLTPEGERAPDAASAASEGAPGTSGTGEEAVAKTEAVKSPWKIVLAGTALKQFTVRAEDQAVREPLSITADQFDVALTDFSLGPDEGSGKRSSLALSLRLNGEGTASIQGDFGLDPLGATFKVNCSNLDLTPGRSYIPERIRVRLNGGKLSADGELKVSHSKETGVFVEYTGNCQLSDLAAVDKLKEQAILGWKGLDLQGMKVANVPLLIQIQKATVRDLESRVAIGPERKLNLLELVEPDPSQPSPASPPAAQAAAPAPPPPAPAPEKSKQPKPKPSARKAAKPESRASTAPAPREVATAPSATPAPAPTKAPSGTNLLVEQIVFENGSIDFSDESIQPAIRTQMMEINGTISGLSSDKSSKADIRLKGSVEKRSPLEITGKLSPFADDLFAEVKLSFKDFDLRRLDPYARKYMGYTLEKGNLTLDLTYLISKRRLDSQNNILFDQLTLGDKVESPDAVSLPVKFAISLLQDRSGGIRLEIPVQGRVDDPQFGLGKIIWKAVSNMILKIVTAPFALLGGLFGGGGGAGAGEDLGSVDFDPGSTALSGNALKKVETVAKIMYERPGLQIDLEGHADPARELDLLRQARLKEIVKAQKAKEPPKKGKEPPAQPEGDIPAAEQEPLLRKAFAEQIGNEDLAKKLSLDVIKKQLLDKVPVSDEEVKSVAVQRAAAVRDQLVNVGKIEAKRIFLVDPKLDSGTGDPKGKPRGVVMKLK